jgi:protein-S-isoprenylcysteine O-methyltransferase Ste14
MSLMPAFELGLWNAWIFMVPCLLISLLSIRLMAEKGAPSPKSVRLPTTTLLFCLLTKFIYFPAVIYSVFLPLKLGTIWFYAGLPIALIGLAGTIIVLMNWANTPTGKPVTGGLYRYSRHPMYVTEVLLLLGVSIVSASWVFLLFPIIIAVGAVHFIKLEEAQTLGHYGAAYREYMNRTPRWIGIPRSKNNDN